jgi:hypothetical protein
MKSNNNKKSPPFTITFRPPAEGLSAYISTYYELNIAKGVAIEDHLHPEWANIRMALGPPWTMGQGKNGQPAALPVQSILHGPASATTYFKGTVGSFGIGILPAGWNRLWRLKASDYADRIVTLMDVLGPETCGAFEAAIHAATSIDDRKLIADDFLIDQISKTKPPRISNEVNDVFQLITNPLTTRVEQITDVLGIPNATLARLCKRAFSFPPKLLLRRQRFLRMLGTLHARPYDEWPEFIDPQYVDQSHMIRDFQYFLGMSPSAYFALPRPVLAAATQARSAMFGQPLQGLH